MGESDNKMPPDGFPAGMRVFAVDDDSVVLRTLELLLLKCGYRVTVADHALEALRLLRANKGEYDLVITDVNMPDMDGFKLLEIVGLEMDLPVIMLSIDFDFKTVMKGIMHGAVDYLVKPVRLEELKLIWKHVAKRSFTEKKNANDISNNLDHASRSEHIHIPQFTKKCKDRRRERDEVDSIDSEDESASQKRARVTWTPELHAKFINVVNQLGIDRAVPKKILDIMEVPGLSRENVASHLQKYRKGLNRNAIGLSQQLFDNAGTSGYNGSSLPMTVNRQRPAICSFDRSNANIYRNKSMISSYLSGHALVPQTWFPPSFCRQYMMNSLGSQLKTQLPTYQTFKPCLNKLDCYAQNCQNLWISDEYTYPNSVPQVGYPLAQQATKTFLNNNLLVKNNTNELNAVFAFEQEQQQFSPCSGGDVEIGAQINMDSMDIQSCDFEDYRGSSTSELEVALMQIN